jgi:hypothetical protein
LLQGRQWAVHEIVRLRAELAKMPGAVARDSLAATVKSNDGHLGAENASPNPLRLVRSKELRLMIGLSHIRQHPLP